MPRDEQPATLSRRAAVPFVLVTIFLDVMGVALIIPVLPALVGEFAGGRDLQSYWYGLLASAYGVMQFVAAPVLGALSDRFGRRPVLLASVFGLGLDFLLQARAGSLWMLLVARLIGGATGASFSVGSAYIADVTAPDERSKGFGAIGATFGLGFIIGPVIGGLLGDHDIRLPFYAAAAVCLLNGLYGLFVLPESLAPENRAPIDRRKLNPFAAVMGLSQVHGVGGLVGVFALSTLAQFILQATWVLYTGFRFGWGPRDNGIALFVVGVGAALVQGVFLRVLLDRWGEKRIALLGLASNAVAFALYGLARQGWMMYAIILANMAGFAAGPALQGIVSKSVDPTRQGITMGSLNGLSSIASVIAPLIGTALLAQVGHLPPGDWRVGATFFLSALLQTVALGIAVVQLRARRRSGPPE